ncbi:MAG: hypothetical protein H6550_15535 [Chitinophagales bacterium]|nr:hypothetical protein [Chitinophagales bacterium]
MQTTIQKPETKKLFTNKFFTYVVTDNHGHGRVVEVEVTVVGKTISYTYTNIKHRQ